MKGIAMNSAANSTRQLTVYWDVTPNWEGWSYKLTNGDAEKCGRLFDYHHTLSEAIDQACHVLLIPATHDDFATSGDDGGYGVWTEGNRTC